MELDAYRYVFVVTYGRSGSTLLINILNSIPGYRIRGENMNTLFGLFSSVQAARRARDDFAGEFYRPSWEGVRDIDVPGYARACLEAFVLHVLSPQPGDKVLGFKEIRYMRQPRDLDAYLEFMEDMFPGAKLILNIRDADKAARSGWWKKREGSKELIDGYNRLLVDLADRRPDTRYLVRYDDYIANAAALEPMFAFLEEAFNRERVSQVIASGKFS